MIRLTPVVIGIAGLVFAVASVALGIPKAVPIHAESARSEAQHRLSRVGHAAAPQPCATNFATYSFVGIPTGNNEISGGDHAGIASGYNNYACDSDSGVLTGENNTVGGNDMDDSKWAAIGSGLQNTITSGAESFIASGTANTIDDAESFIGAGESNSLSGYQSAIVGGSGNTISQSVQSFIGAGYGSKILGYDAFIGAGVLENVSGMGSFIGAGGSAYYYKCDCSNRFANSVTGADAFIGAGDGNVVNGNGSFIGAGGFTSENKSTSSPSNQISGVDAFIGAGDVNTIVADDGFIGAGYNNLVTGEYGSIVGGGENTASATYATVIGGFLNTASGQYAIVAGGNADTASGILSYAAGYHAGATHNGSFVWSDYSSGSATVKDSAANQFVVRASGGTTIYSNEGATSGVKLAAGSGTWASLSDRNAKADIVPLDGVSILAKVDALPVSEWRYKTEAGVRHAGPMAQDFYAAFGVGEDDRHITSIDEDGIALAAIKALHRENAGLASRLARVQADQHRKDGEVAALRAELRRFEASARR